MSAQRVCLVTDEFHPFTGGGIGRLLSNIVQDSVDRRAPVEFHLLVPAWAAEKFRGREALLPANTTLHFAEIRTSGEPSTIGDCVYPPRHAFSDTEHHAVSLDLMLALRRLVREVGPFDVIEFPDYRGWAFCTLMEKRLDPLFADTEISVRLHTTEGIIQRYEGTAPTLTTMATFELERRSLEEADRVVAPLPSIAAYNQRFYGFDEAWMERVLVQFPPAVVDAPESTPKGSERNLVFVTKVQTCKRPDLFVRGAAQFLLDHPEFTGRALLACHVQDEALRARLERMIPPSLKDRFAFAGGAEVRARVIPNGIVVIPSDYESLNLAAYEASCAGATVVLNERCPAFGDDTPFVAGRNCLKFDGTVDGLAATLVRAWKAPPTERVDVTAEPPYWETRPLRRTAPPPAAVGEPRVSVVITNHNLGRWLPETIQSVLASTWREIEIVVVDDASTEELDQLLLERMEREARDGASLKVIRNRVNRGLSASRNIGIRAATGKYVLPLDADDCITSRFLALAVNALERNPTHDVVVPQTGYFASDEERAQLRFIDFALFLGNVTSLGVAANRFSCATALVRRQKLLDHPYDETLTSFEDWALWLELARTGSRFLVTNDLHFHYRRRPGSMISGVDHARHFALLSRLVTRGVRAVGIDALVASIGSAHEARNDAVERLRIAASAELDRPLRYDVADALNAALKRVSFVHPAIKRTMRRTLRSGQEP